MRKKGICFGLILALLLPFVFTTEVKASDNTELNIYALYLNSEKKGDSTLLESKGHYLLMILAQTITHLQSLNSYRHWELLM